MPQIRPPSWKSNSWKCKLLKRSKNDPLWMLAFMLILLKARTEPSKGLANLSKRSAITKSIKSAHLKILVVDNDPKFRKALCFNLNKQYTAMVDQANSGEAGIEAVQAGKVYDLIMLDLRMPVKNGIQTYQELVKIAPAGCKFALMSAWPDSEEWEIASKLNVVLLNKPIHEDYLRELLNDCVGD